MQLEHSLALFLVLELLLLAFLVMFTLCLLQHLADIGMHLRQRLAALKCPRMIDILQILGRAETAQRLITHKVTCRSLLGVKPLQLLSLQ